ncbi:MAG: hypothetical protein LBM00_09640 [Deltaproteobacteria bacterium]|jgi:hypothetical protein|nr:hypothetical protein [Deltaproteobacteria bacterium]
MPAARARVYAALAVGFLGICITGILFFTIVDEPSKTQLAGFYSLIFSEMLSTVLIILVERRKSHLAGAFGRAGIYSSILIYFCAAALLGIVFMAGVFTGAKWLYAVHSVFLCLLGIFLIVIFAASGNISRENAALRETMEKLQQLENRLGMLRARNPEADWAGRAAQCQEAIRFFDCTRAVPADALLADSIDKLEMMSAQKQLPDNGREAAIRGLLEEIFALAQQRNMEAQNKLS